MARLLVQKTKWLVMLSQRQHHWAGGRLGSEGQPKLGQAELEASEAHLCRCLSQYLQSLGIGDGALGMPASNRQGTGLVQAGAWGAGEKVSKQGEETQGRGHCIGAAQRDSPDPELGRRRSRRVVGDEAAGHRQGQPLWGPDPNHPRPPWLSFPAIQEGEG